MTDNRTSYTTEYGITFQGELMQGQVFTDKGDVAAYIEAAVKAGQAREAYGVMHRTVVRQPWAPTTTPQAQA